MIAAAEHFANLWDHSRCKRLGLQMRRKPVVSAAPCAERSTVWAISVLPVGMARVVVHQGVFVGNHDHLPTRG